LTRLLAQIKGTKADARIRAALCERIQERIGAEGDALALAMRVITCAAVGIKNEIDLRALLSRQCEDGGWENGWIYKYGSSGIAIGNRGLVTALALKAIEAVNNFPSTSPPRLAPTPGPSKGHRRNKSYSGEFSSTIRRQFHWPWFRASA
jgi:hypothetical protein